VDLVGTDRDVERVVNSIVDEVFKEVSEEIRRAFDESLSMLKKARGEVLQEVRKRVGEGRRRAEAERLRRISAAEMKAKWARVQLLDEFVNQVFGESLNKLRELRNKGQYKAILVNLVLEGLAALNTRSAILVGSREDTHLLVEVAERLSGQSYSVKVSNETVETVGGVKVLLEDGSITYDNTFEARLERIKPELRRRLYTLVGD
jgi:V/A-type H+-transporting ATPase subunit E